MILIPLQKLPNNLVDLGKIMAATGFEWLPKVLKIARSGNTGGDDGGGENCFFFYMDFLMQTLKQKLDVILLQFSAAGDDHCFESSQIEN